MFNFLKKFKLVNTNKNCIIPLSDLKYYFKLSPQEYRDAQRIYKEKGTISYEFSPNGIGYEVKIHCKDGEIINITDITSW